METQGGISIEPHNVASEKQLDPLERIANALEKLVEEPPEVEIDFGPPMCPSCGMMNPIITLPAQEEQRGPMVENFMVALCERCNCEIYIVTESYSVHTSIDTVKIEIEQKKAGFSNE